MNVMMYCVMLPCNNIITVKLFVRCASDFVVYPQLLRPQWVKDWEKTNPQSSRKPNDSASHQAVFPPSCGREREQLSLHLRPVAWGIPLWLPFATFSIYLGLFVPRLFDTSFCGFRNPIINWGSLFAALWTSYLASLCHSVTKWFDI